MCVPSPKVRRFIIFNQPFVSGAILLLLIVLTTCNSAAGPTDRLPQQKDSVWKLVWQDEFDGDRIDQTKWNYEIGAGGWGNNELEYYTGRTENAYIENGHLVIKAIEETYRGAPFTSARMTTKNKGDWKYGRFEIRARLPRGKGIWPAIWMLPTDWVYGGWAASGEIDIMELLGDEVNKVYGTIHYGGSYPTNVHSGAEYKLNRAPNFADGFHTFSLEWDSTSISWIVDDSLYQKQSNWYASGVSYPAPFNKRFHLLLNLAVGGNWPGNPDPTTRFPQKMIVDYVRVYVHRPMP